METLTGADKPEDASVNANVVLVIYGDLGHSQPRPLGGTKRKPYQFKEAAKDQFDVSIFICNIRNY